MHFSFTNVLWYGQPDATCLCVSGAQKDHKKTLQMCIWGPERLKGPACMCLHSFSRHNPRMIIYGSVLPSDLLLLVGFLTQLESVAARRVHRKEVSGYIASAGPVAHAPAARHGTYTLGYGRQSRSAEICDRMKDWC